MAYTIKDLAKRYKLNLRELETKIKKEKPQKVLLQFPEGIKPYALSITSFLQKKFPSIEFRIWLGSCFGACDIPRTSCDLLVQFGHAPWA